MMVCAHGDVAEYCEGKDMIICDKWDGDLREYSGMCRVIVTDIDVSKNEYYFLKGELLAKGIELISTRHKDDELMSEYLVYAASRQREKYGARVPFGYHRVNGEIVEHPENMAVARRIRELKKAGFSLAQIREDEGARKPDGSRLSISTIQKIIKNER